MTASNLEPPASSSFDASERCPGERAEHQMRDDDDERPGINEKREEVTVEKGVSCQEAAGHDSETRESEARQQLASTTSTSAVRLDDKTAAVTAGNHRQNQQATTNHSLKNHYFSHHHHHHHHQEQHHLEQPQALIPLQYHHTQQPQQSQAISIYTPPPPAAAFPIASAAPPPHHHQPPLSFYHHYHHHHQPTPFISWTYPITGSHNLHHQQAHYIYYQHAHQHHLAASPFAAHGLPRFGLHQSQQQQLQAQHYAIVQQHPPAHYVNAGLAQPMSQLGGLAIQTANSQQLVPVDGSRNEVHDDQQRPSAINENNDNENVGIGSSASLGSREQLWQQQQPSDSATNGLNSPRAPTTDPAASPDTAALCAHCDLIQRGDNEDAVVARVEAAAAATKNDARCEQTQSMGRQQQQRRRRQKKLNEISYHCQQANEGNEAHSARKEDEEEEEENDDDDELGSCQLCVNNDLPTRAVGDDANLSSSDSDCNSRTGDYENDGHKSAGLAQEANSTISLASCSHQTSNTVACLDTPLETTAAANSATGCRDQGRSNLMVKPADGKQKSHGENHREEEVCGVSVQQHEKKEDDRATKRLGPLSPGDHNTDLIENIKKAAATNQSISINGTTFYHVNPAAIFHNQPPTRQLSQQQIFLNYYNASHLASPAYHHQQQQQQQHHNQTLLPAPPAANYPLDYLYPPCLPANISISNNNHNVLHNYSSATLIPHMPGQAPYGQTVAGYPQHHSWLTSSSPSSIPFPFATTAQHQDFTLNMLPPYHNKMFSAQHQPVPLSNQFINESMQPPLTSNINNNTATSNVSQLKLGYNLIPLLPIIAIPTRIRQAYGMDKVWQDEFEQLFSHFISQVVWTLVEVETNPNIRNSSKILDYENRYVVRVDSAIAQAPSPSSDNFTEVAAREDENDVDDDDDDERDNHQPDTPPTNADEDELIEPARVVDTSNKSEQHNVINEEPSDGLLVTTTSKACWPRIDGKEGDEEIDQHGHLLCNERNSQCESDCDSGAILNSSSASSGSNGETTCSQDELGNTSDTGNASANDHHSPTPRSITPMTDSGSGEANKHTNHRQICPGNNNNKLQTRRFPLKFKMFIDSAKVRFCCETCGHGWTSMKGRVVFWYELFELVDDDTRGAIGSAATNTTTSKVATSDCHQQQAGVSNLIGYCAYKLFGQKCDVCKVENRFERPMWYPEEVTKVLCNLYNKIGQVYFGFRMPAIDKQRRAGKPKTSHNSLLCQACHDGVCTDRK